MFRHTYPELENTLIQEARKTIPDGFGRYTQNDHRWQFPNGSSIFFQALSVHSRMPTITEVLNSTVLYIDELTEFTKDIFDFLSSRVRISKDIVDRFGNHPIKPQTKCATNPGGIGHGWVKAMFIDPMPQGGRIERDIFVEEYNQVVHQAPTNLYRPYLRDNDAPGH